MLPPAWHRTWSTAAAKLVKPSLTCGSITAPAAEAPSMIPGARRLPLFALGYVGLQIVTPFVAYRVVYISYEARQEIMADYREHLGKLCQLPMLSYPPLGDFDMKS